MRRVYRVTQDADGNTRVESSEHDLEDEVDWFAQARPGRRAAYRTGRRSLTGDGLAGCTACVRELLRRPHACTRHASFLSAWRQSGCRCGSFSWESGFMFRFRVLLIKCSVGARSSWRVRSGRARRSWAACCPAWRTSCCAACRPSCAACSPRWTAGRRTARCAGSAPTPPVLGIGAHLRIQALLGDTLTLGQQDGGRGALAARPLHQW